MVKKASRAQLEEKLRLERIFKPDIKRLFNRQLERFRASVATSGIRPHTQPELWKSALQEHYQRVRKAFLGRVDIKSIAGIETKQSEEEAALEAAILAALLDWETTHAGQQAYYIAGTNAEEMEESINEARQALLDQGEVVTNAALAVSAVAILRRKFRARVDIIAMTETQTSAENVKATEATMANDAAGLEAYTIKTWRTRGDAKVRADHRAVNGQRRQLRQAFDVGGSRLMFPGDVSLGAPIKQIAGCRCESEYQRVSKSVYQGVGV